jgi:hypothetical protein
MLVVEVNCALNCVVAENISVGQVLRNDTTSGLFFLCDLVAISLGIGYKVASIVISRPGSARNFDLRCTKLGVVE